MIVAGLIAKPGLHQMIAGRGHDARLNGELAAVDAELRLGVERQGKIRSGRVDGIFEAHAGVFRYREGGGDELVLFGRMGVDV